MRFKCGALRKWERGLRSNAHTMIDKKWWDDFGDDFKDICERYSILGNWLSWFVYDVVQVQLGGV